MVPLAAWGESAVGRPGPSGEADRMNRRQLASLIVVLATAVPARAQAPSPSVVRLGDLDVTQGEQARRKPVAHKSRDGKPITIAGHVYDNGVGTESFGTLVVDLA